MPWEVALRRLALGSAAAAAAVAGLLLVLALVADGPAGAVAATRALLGLT